MGTEADLRREMVGECGGVGIFGNYGGFRLLCLVLDALSLGKVWKSWSRTASLLCVNHTYLCVNHTYLCVHYIDLCEKWSMRARGEKIRENVQKDINLFILICFN